MASKKVKKVTEEVSSEDRLLLEKYRENIELVHKQQAGLVRGFSTDDMKELHYLYTKYVNPTFTLNLFCGRCKGIMLDGLYKILNG